MKREKQKEGQNKKKRKIKNERKREREEKVRAKKKDNGSVLEDGMRTNISEEETFSSLSLAILI